MKRRNILVLAAIILAVSGCSNKPEDAKVSAENVTSGDVNEKVTIRFENHGANKHELFAEAVQIFNESQDNIYVDFQTNTQDWEASLWAALAVNDAPDIITHIAQGKIPQYVDAGHLLDLATLNCSRFIDEKAQNAVSYNGGIYGLPIQTEIYGVFYNKDIFQKAGITEIPKTLDELETVIKKLTPLKSEGIYSFAAQYRDPGQLGFYMTYGGAGSLYQSVVEQGLENEDVTNGKYTFENDRVTNIFRLYDIVKKNSQPKPEDTDYTTHNTLFASGESAMLIMGNWTISQMRELSPDLNVGMFALPVSDNPDDAVFAEDYNLVINVNAHTEKKEAVDTFLSFFCDYTKPTKEFFIKNALPTGLKGFDKVVTYDSCLAAPLEAVKTSEYFTRILPNGFDVGKSIQEFMLDSDMSPSEGASLLQKNYKTHAENMQ
ncbi:extracellular solute-binding protein [Hungatella sp.]|uniref:ABC transporter substrate-binding protein n=1 Tax=Hungatella sp. TaxID=2613924 RepID=UPI002A80CAF6|nr:extracellular solute-binding protein [Hungatella sp.]